ncbi:MAG TPA: LysE family transporter [Candidatus Sulfomarinibacteraceae bacterium]|nr:LysE family transporter [Candidatus Sulfomarinibacteraceae bacterium]
MVPAFVAGALAGWAIAIPIGAIAVLIMETGIRRGFRVAAAAGAGAASADGAFAALAVVGGTALTAVLEPLEQPLRIVAIGMLLAIGVRGLLLMTIAARSVPAAAALPTRVLPTYLRFLGLTLLNPQTVVYFAALIIAVPDVGRGPGERGAFVAGAFLASLSWQLVLAAVGAVAHHRLPRGFQTGVSLLGNLAICGFAVVLALDL